MLKSDVNAYIGDFGAYQLRVFVVVFFLGMFSTDSIQIVFIGAGMPHWCRVPELDRLPDDVQKNVAIPPGLLRYGPFTPSYGLAV